MVPMAQDGFANDMHNYINVHRIMMYFSKAMC